MFKQYFKNHLKSNVFHSPLVSPSVWIAANPLLNWHKTQGHNIIKRGELTLIRRTPFLSFPNFANAIYPFLCELGDSSWVRVDDGGSVMICAKNTTTSDLSCVSSRAERIAPWLCGLVLLTYVAMGLANGASLNQGKLRNFNKRRPRVTRRR